MIKNHLLQLFVFFFLTTFSIQAQTNFGAEIVSRQKFGEGLMVTRAKMIPMSGVVSNLFFYNRADEPYNGNVWYEYDWELRGAHPNSGWSQIRVRPERGERLVDAPVDVPTSTNIGENLFNYILIRKGNTYVYDIRKDFNVNTYNYNNASAHGGNSVSLINGGPRKYNTGGAVDHIPANQRLDFSIGITAFDSGWSGPLPTGSYSGDYVVDYTRFYGFSGNNLNRTPQWQDEFNNGNLDYGKWQVANWTFRATQFTQNNIRFENGKIILKVNRNSGGNINTSQNLALSGTASQSSTRSGGSARRAIDNNTNGNFSSRSVTHTASQSNAWWKVELQRESKIGRIEIHNRVNCCQDRLSNFSVSVLDENQKVVWTKFYSNPPSPSRSINVDAVGKFVRINLEGILSLAEVKVFGEAVSGGSSATNNIVHITKRNARTHALDGGQGGFNGKDIYLWQTNLGNVNQQWVELDRGNGYFSYKKRNTNFCIDGGGGGARNQNVKLWSCNASNQNQHWKKQSAGGGSFKMIKRNAPFAIDGKNGGSNGQSVKLWNQSSSHQNLNWFISTIGVVPRFEAADEYHSFTARKEGEKVSLSWIVDQVQTPIQFEIEHKNAAGDYQLLDVVAAVADDIQVYKFVHDSPEIGENTYRIKAIFADYSVVYLDPQAVSFDVNEASLISPNPTKGNLLVNLSDYTEMEVTLIFTDLSGKVYFTKNIDRDHSAIIGLDISEYQNGFYMLNVNAANRPSKTEKISLQNTY